MPHLKIGLIIIAADLHAYNVYNNNNNINSIYNNLFHNAD